MLFKKEVSHAIDLESSDGARILEVLDSRYVSFHRA